MNRRRLLSRLLSAPLAVAYTRAADSAPRLRVTGVETVYWKSRDDAPFWPHWTWVRIQTDAGHGAGKPLSMQIEESADVLAFLAYHVGMDGPKRP